MTDKIKFKKLKNIAERIAEKPVNITSTTMFDAKDERKAVVTFNKSRVDIVINSLRIKSVEDVIEAISHEIAHVRIGSDKHNDEFAKLWNELYSKIRVEYIA